MPRLNPNDKKIANLELNGALPELPDLVALAKNADPRAMAIGQAELGAQSATIWQIGGQRILGAILSNTGIPSGKAFDAAMSAIEIQPTALDVLKILRAAMGGTVDKLTKSSLQKAFADGIGIATDLIGSIPVAGWVAGAIIDAGVAIFRLVKLVQESDKPPEVTYERATFSPWLDRAMAQGVIATTAYKLDWNALFSPPGIGSTHAYIDAVTAQNLKHGIRFSISGMNEGYSEGWTGYVPGRDRVTAQIEVVTMESGSSFLQVYDTGRLFPSLCDLSTLAWATITRNSPQMYCVDAAELMRRWRSYLGQIRDWIQSTGKLNTSQKEVVVSKLKPIYGWSSFNPDTEIQDWDGYQIDDSYPVKMLTTLRAQQLAFLDTITIAYLDETFEAFRRDTEMRDKLRTNLPLLLQHPARCRVDMANVRDEDYRKALIDSGAGVPSCTGMGLASGKFGKIKKVPAFPKGPGGSTSGSAASGAGVAVAALAAIALLAGRR